MLQLSYVSRATQPMSRDALSVLLAQSQRFNAEHDITGLLLYRNDAFMQVLEGDKPTVLALYDRIRVDPRHHQVRFLYMETIPAREFGDWSMALVDLDDPDLEGIEGLGSLSSADIDLMALADDIATAKKALWFYRRYA